MRPIGGTTDKNHYVALMRIYDQITKAAVYASVTCVARFVAVVTGAFAGGLVRVSVALLVVSCAEGLYAVPAIRRALKGDRVPAREGQGSAPRMRRRS